MKSVLMRVSQKEQDAMISIENAYLSDSNKMSAMVDKLKKSFDILCYSSVSLESGCSELDVARIIVKAPMEKCL